MIYRLISLGCLIPLGLFASGAFAQERWAGAYAGLSISAQESQTALEGNSTHTFKENAATIGAFGGVNFVRPNGFVWGPDVLLSGLSASGSANDATFGQTQMEGSFLLSPRMRLGFATEKSMFYGLIGFGISDLAVKASSDSDTDIIISGAFGIGAEFAMNDTWSTRIEAVHYNFDGLDFTANGGKTPIKSEVNQLTIGISRKF